MVVVVVIVVGCDGSSCYCCSGRKNVKVPKSSNEKHRPHH